MALLNLKAMNNSQCACFANKFFLMKEFKPSRMIDHLKSRHSDKTDRDVDIFINLRDNRKTMGSMFRKVDTQNDDGLIASYNISLLFAKAGKSHTIGKTTYSSRNPGGSYHCHAYRRA